MSDTKVVCAEGEEVEQVEIESVRKIRQCRQLREQQDKISEPNPSTIYTKREA